METQEKGFSLIELLVVVSIILIIAAIAIPNLLRSRMAANQASAVQSCRLLNSSEIAYSSTYGHGFSTTLVQLAAPPGNGVTSASAAGLVDSVLAAGYKSGYNFTYAPAIQETDGSYQGYNLNANPSQVGISGNNYYFTDQSFVIRENNTSVASASDSTVAN